MTIVYFILILGITIFIHELGHFIWAKKAKIHVYEFSLGMGPLLKSWHRKNDETEYSLRLLPIGGYVSMAGEDMEDDPDIPDDKKLGNKSWGQRFMTIVAGIMHNFLLALIIFFIVGLAVGGTSKNAYITLIDEDTPAYESKLEVGDKILKLNGKNITADNLTLKLAINKDKSIRLTVEHTDGTLENIVMSPKKIEDEEGVNYRFGFGISTKSTKGLWESVKYAFRNFCNLFAQMLLIIWYLITGKLGLNSLSGPVGIYSVVGQASKAGFINVVYLLGYISLNVGFINFLPIPAFDGGRLFFLIVEKIKGSKVSPKFENTVHAIGMVFLIALMVFITYNDIVRIFF